MYSGLLPQGLTEDDLSPDDEDDEQEGDAAETMTGDEKSESSVGKLNSTEEDTRTNSAAGDAQIEYPTCSMPGISQEMWQKFQDLRKKNHEMKTLKVPRKRKRRHKKVANLTKTQGDGPQETREHQAEREQHWDELKQYFGVNDRFHPPACSKPPSKSGLEKSIERAIAEGDIAKAEEMSDRLATRELAVNIAQAADCRDFVRHKQEEELSRAAQKRKKEIAWGFEAKQRWETKSNMGFM
ncbi:protein FAM204A isoform X2 [Nelusetta ayraudi]|uniref:protein FAM204A isoform X2 n=1 Tax=Nelusetta ayraudi TaxID=303726 RepID=UPI003F719141